MAAEESIYFYFVWVVILHKFRSFLCSRSSFGFIAYVTMDRRVLSLTWMEPPEMCRQPYAVDRRINLSNLYSHLNYVKAWIAVFIPILHAFEQNSTLGSCTRSCCIF
ncbi:hypothetical protein NPIL_590481 [Nephila pilipes]|uniref:Uncharacterized protein n=1 Tax=Nephila pilipes TaxID=299642 RepID=A0A8X6MPP5_NEPPI|nr:hypothetical protein NPIL_590481 [Nephila pilipes]